MLITNICTYTNAFTQHNKYKFMQIINYYYKTENIVQYRELLKKILIYVYNCQL